MKTATRVATVCLGLIPLILLAIQSANACSRAVYFGKAGQTVTGRTMDWTEDMATNLWVFPRGMQRDGGLRAKFAHPRVVVLIPATLSTARISLFQTLRLGNSSSYSIPLN